MRVIPHVLLHAALPGRLLLRQGLAALVLALGLTGCGGAARIGSLQSMVMADRPATSAEILELQVFRRGQRVTPALEMGLRKDDEIEVPENATVVLLFEAGYELVLAPGSRITILNPSVFLARGRAFVRKIRETIESFRVQTEFATAGSERTQFLVTVEPDSAMTVTVAEGTVRVESNTGLWPPVYYQRLEHGVVRAGSPPEPARTLRPEELEGRLEWIREVEVRIPRLVGQTEVEARRMLEQQRLVVGTVRPRITGESEAGTVLEQDPLPGSPAWAGARVDLVVEEESVVVPDVQGQSVEQARRRLNAVGLRVGEIRETPRERDREGRVLSQTPRAGQRASAGGRVDLEVATEGVRVPDLRGRTQAEAENLLREARLRLGDISYTDRAGQARPGTVTNQNPRAGSVVEPNRAVRIEMARPAEQPQSCTVPSVIRLTRPAAERRIQEARLRVGRVTVYETGDTVTGQDPQAGTAVPCGSAVNLQIGAIG